MKKILAVSLTALVCSQSAFAKTLTDRMIESKNVIGLVYVDEETQEKCILSVDSKLIEVTDLLACTEQQKEVIREINDAPKNPDLAVINAIAGVVMGYYTLCSTIQASPYVVKKALEGTDDRSRAEKIKDVFVPSKEQRKRNSFQDAVESFANDMTSSVCSPVANFNRKLIYLFSDKK